MAIEIEIPKDITKYESKLIGPLTTRQTICLVPAAGLGIAIYNILKPYIATSPRVFLIMVVAIPFLLCGWFKPYGMPFEKFIQSVFVSIVLAPKNRKYVTVNVYDEINKSKYTFPNNNNNKNKANNKTKGKKDKAVHIKECIAYK